MWKSAFALIVAASFAAWLPAAGAIEGPNAEPIPTEAFAALPLVSDPVLSPDGERIAARVYRDGRERLAIFRLSGRSAEPPSIIDLGEDNDLRGWEWAGNDRLLVRVVRVEGFYGQEVPVSRVIVYDRVAGTAVPVRAGPGAVADDIIFIDPQGRHILLAAQPNPFASPVVYRIDLSNGRATTVEHARDQVWNWFADSNGVVRAGVDYGETSIRIFYREAADRPLRVLQTRRRPRDGSVVEQIHFRPDSDRGVIVTNAETGRFGVYEYDFGTDTRGATLFEHPEVDVGNVIKSESGLIEGAAYEDERPRVRWFNPDLERMQATIDRALPGRTNVIRGLSDDRSRVLIWTGTADDPGAYAIFRPAERRIDAFAEVQDSLQDRVLAPVRPITYRSRDGLTIHGYLTLPPGRPERGLPLVVMPHGGPFARDSWTFDPWVQLLAARGYAVLQPNFRGSTGYGREFVEAGEGQWGTGMTDDIDDGVAWLAGEGIADPARVCLMGASYGGYAALWGAIRGAGRYRCAISFAGVSDVGALLRYDARFIVPQRSMRERRREVRGEGEARIDLDTISPLQQAARLNVPVLIAHGEGDRRVPVSQSRNLVRALERRGAELESVFYEEAGHGFTRPEDSLDFLRRVEAFLARHNPADAFSPSASGTAADGDGVSNPPASR